MTFSLCWLLQFKTEWFKWQSSIYRSRPFKPHNLVSFARIICSWKSIILSVVQNDVFGERFISFLYPFPMSPWTPNARNIVTRAIYIFPLATEHFFIIDIELRREMTRQFFQADLTSWRSDVAKGIQLRELWDARKGASNILGFKVGDDTLLLEIWCRWLNIFCA